MPNNNEKVKKGAVQVRVLDPELRVLSLAPSKKQKKPELFHLLVVIPNLFPKQSGDPIYC